MNALNFVVAALCVATIVRRSDTADESEEHLSLLAPPPAIAVEPCA